MTLQSAPFYHDVAEGPAAQTYWLHADDGVRIRVAHWAKDNSRGTVLLLPGRTEYIEKYGRAAAEFTSRGYDMVAIDWRGQGLADRLVANRDLGYIGKFTDYQRDLAAVLKAAADLDLPKPWFMVGHSMGGCIGLRALMEDLPVNAAVFSGPMWGISLAPAVRPVAWVLSTLSKPLGFDTRYAPGTSDVTYVLDNPFEDNSLTTDPDMYAYMQRQMRDHGDLSLAGPSLRWLNEALVECRHLSQQPAPDMPCLTFLGTNERIVDTDAVHKRMASWTNGTLDMVENGEHEVMLEPPASRNRLFDAAVAHFAAHS